VYKRGMALQDSDFFLFLGSADSDSAKTRLRAIGASYRKKLLSSRVENWRTIIEMVKSPQNRGTLVQLTDSDYSTICIPNYADVAADLLDALSDRPHVIFVHEAVFLTDEQRNEAAVAAEDDDTEYIMAGALEDQEVWLRTTREEIFGTTQNDVRQRVNTMLRDRGLNVRPYRKNIDRAIMAGSFLDDHERHLLFRFYVPSGRLYAHEFDTLLGLFRDWLGQTGHAGIRQDSYSTKAGQVFEFFSAVGLPKGGIGVYLWNSQSSSRTAHPYRRAQ
jgi:hypothetical protein